MDLWTVLGVALVGYLAGMLGSAFYAFLVYRKVPKQPGGEEIFFLVFLFQLIKMLQLPKLGVAVAAALLAVWLAPSALAAYGVAAGACFLCSGLVFGWLALRVD